jgi:3-hydroxyisobutyrate/3-hydroxypropionate dehydrogenase
MGYAMAGNLRKKMAPQTPLIVNDISPSACERFAREFDSYGPVQIVPSAKEAAARAKILISIVPGAAEVRDVFLDPESGVIAAPKNTDRLLLDCSTIDCETSRDVGARLKDAGSGIFRDAPVSVRYRSCPFPVLN